jgi:hypothetical protein
LMLLAVPVNFTFVFLSQGTFREHARYLPTVTALMVIAMVLECLSTWAALVQHARRKNVGWTSWQRQGLEEAIAALPSPPSEDGVSSATGHLRERLVGDRGVLVGLPAAADTSRDPVEAVAPHLEAATGSVPGDPATARVGSALTSAGVRPVAGGTRSPRTAGRDHRGRGLPIRLGSPPHLGTVGRVVWAAVTRELGRHRPDRGLGSQIRRVRIPIGPVDSRGGRRPVVAAGIRAASSMARVATRASRRRHAGWFTAPLPAAAGRRVASLLSALPPPSQIARASLGLCGFGSAPNRARSAVPGSLQRARLPRPDAGRSGGADSWKRVPLLRERAASLTPTLSVLTLLGALASLRGRAARLSPPSSVRERANGRLMALGGRGRPSTWIARMVVVASRQPDGGPEASRSWGIVLDRSKSAVGPVRSANHGGSSAAPATLGSPDAGGKDPGCASVREHPERTLAIPVIGGRPAVPGSRGGLLKAVTDGTDAGGSRSFEGTGGSPGLRSPGHRGTDACGASTTCGTDADRVPASSVQA